MLNNLIFLVGATPEEESAPYLDFIWSATGSRIQEQYHYATTQPGYALALAPDNIFDPEKNDVRQPPHLFFPSIVPDLLDGSNAELARFDVLLALDSAQAAMQVEPHPVIAHPVSAGEELIISLEAQFMVLLPMDENKDTSIQPLFRWQPYPGSYESVVARFLRDDEGDTAIDLTHYKADFSAEIARFAFSQWKLNDPRMIFRLAIRGDSLEFFVNGDSIGSMPYASSEVGDGHLTILYPQNGEQGANIAGIHLVRVSRRSSIE